jgi:peptide chain release factor 2
MLSQKEFQEYIESAKNLIKSIRQNDSESQKSNLEKELENPSIWGNPGKASEINQKLAKINKEIEKRTSINGLIASIEVAFDFELESDFEDLKKELDKELEEIQNSQFMNGKFDSQGVILSLHAGAGGNDAQDWTAMLCSMYQAFAKNQGWSCSIISLSLGEEAGVKSASIEIQGENVYGLLKEEAGVHRLVRISPFNSGGTRETSFAMVEVLPNNLNSEVNIEIPEKDIRTDTFMSGGKGGQGVNTTYSAVRLVHIPTGISVQCQDQRSQIQNKARALEVLTNRLAAIELRKQKEFEREIKGGLVSNEWGSQIRSYVLHPYKMIKDHRSGWESADVLKVIEQGDLLPIIWSVKKSSKE